jgi:hypothetical protein
MDRLYKEALSDPENPFFLARMANAYFTPVDSAEIESDDTIPERDSTNVKTESDDKSPERDSTDGVSEVLPPPYNQNSNDGTSVATKRGNRVATLKQQAKSKYQALVGSG